jgi:AcrR family transcriptional regulator
VSEKVNSRRYESPLRQRQAADTRRVVLDAAEQLFTTQPYGATRLPDVAAKAGVSLATVKQTFGTKSELLLQVWHRRLAGGLDDPVPVADRDWYKAIFTGTDPRAKLRALAAGVRAVRPGIARLSQAIETAAQSDPDIAELHNRMQREFYANQKAIVQHLADGGFLRSGLTVETGSDLLYTLNSIHNFDVLVNQRGWTLDEYEQWLAQILEQQLLDRRRGSRSPA